MPAQAQAFLLRPEKKQLEAGVDFGRAGPLLAKTSRIAKCNGRMKQGWIHDPHGIAPKFVQVASFETDILTRRDRIDRAGSKLDGLELRTVE